MDVDIDLTEFIVDVYKSGKPGYLIASDHDIPVQVVYKTLKRMGVTRSNSLNSRKYSVDHDFFSNIDDEKKAYWAGFIQTDGYLTSREHKIGIALAIKDIGHLEKFNKDISSTYPIKTYLSSGYVPGFEYCRVVVSSKQMHRDLTDLGITTQKTKTTKPVIIDDKLRCHYVRGLMDGDGSIAVSRSSKAGYKGSYVSATKDMAKFVSGELGHGHVWFDSAKRVWYADFTLNERNLGYLYDGASTYLHRKFERAVLARRNLSSAC